MNFECKIKRYWRIAYLFPHPLTLISSFPNIFLETRLEDVQTRCERSNHAQPPSLIEWNQAWVVWEKVRYQIHDLLSLEMLHVQKTLRSPPGHITDLRWPWMTSGAPDMYLQQKYNYWIPPCGQFTSAKFSNRTRNVEMERKILKQEAKCWSRTQNVEIGRKMVTGREILKR